MIVDPLKGDATSFLRRANTISERGARFLAWRRERECYGLWPVPPPGDAANPSAFDFTRRDALGLATEPSIAMAAVEALGRAGDFRDDTTVHALETRLARLLRMPAVVTFASGGAALSGTIAAVVGRGDTIVLDDGVGPALRHAAAASGARVLYVRADDAFGLTQLLEGVRRRCARNAILVAIEASSITCVTRPDIAEWRAACDVANATLLVDVTHDLGVVGRDGTGVLGVQGGLALPHIVAGSLGRGFVAAGGFAAFANLAVAAMVRTVAPVRAGAGPILPWCAASCVAALDLAASPEGAARRARLAELSRHLRSRLGAIAAPGGDGAVVFVPVAGAGVARRVLRRLQADGIALDIVEPPLVPRGQALLRMRVTVKHSFADLERAAAMVRVAMVDARAERDLYLPPRAVKLWMPRVIEREALLRVVI